eukprot:1158139-Pyramimonas_sp.AAC.1
MAMLGGFSQGEADHSPKPIQDGKGGSESWAWFAAISQPLFVGLCAWMGQWRPTLTPMASALPR